MRGRKESEKMGRDKKIRVKERCVGKLKGKDDEM